MSPVVQEYLAKLDELIASREASDGGELSDQEEGRYCDLLDEIWRRLTTEEGETVEAEVEARKKDGRYKMSPQRKA